jgi:hypothetical protein
MLVPKGSVGLDINLGYACHYFRTTGGLALQEIPGAAFGGP